MSSLLATDVRENLLFHELPFALVIGEVSQMEQVAVLEPTLGNGGRGVEDEEQDECLAGMPSFQRIQRTGFPITLLSALTFSNLCHLV